MFTIIYTYRTVNERNSHCDCRKQYDNKRDAYAFSKRMYQRAIETHTTLDLTIYDSERGDRRVCEMRNNYFADVHYHCIKAYPNNPFDFVYVKHN